MSKITIVDLEVSFCVGVTDEERAKPQRLLITVEMDVDFSAAAKSDRLAKTIDYYEVCQSIFKLGVDRNWKLIERLVTDISEMVLNEYRPEGVYVEVKKFAIPQAAFVSVSLAKSPSTPGMVKRSAWGIP